MQAHPKNTHLAGRQALRPSAHLGLQAVRLRVCRLWLQLCVGGSSTGGPPLKHWTTYQPYTSRA